MAAANYVANRQSALIAAMIAGAAITMPRHEAALWGSAAPRKLAANIAASKLATDIATGWEVKLVQGPPRVMVQYATHRPPFFQGFLSLRFAVSYPL